METFTITIAESVVFLVTRIYGGGNVRYEISKDGILHCTLIPYIDDNLGLAWMSHDSIDPSLLYTIGRAIDSYEA